MPTGRPQTIPGRKRRRSPSPSLEKAPDADLVAACAGGDERAWRVLVLRYRRLVYTIPYRMGLDPADADDVFQVTFVRLAERIGSLRDPAKVRAWLVTTARRIALNTVGQRRVVEDPDQALAGIADPSELPPEEIERLEEQQLVRIALARLGERCRRLLSLLYYPGDRIDSMSYESVSREMGIPLGSIGPTRMRCLKKLLAEFKKVERES
jgi:RNA polymerase sigma factor (sigma-70 family)